MRATATWLTCAWFLCTIVVRLLSIGTQEWFKAEATATPSISTSTTTSTTTTTQLALSVVGAIYKIGVTETSFNLNVWQGQCSGDCSTVAAKTCSSLPTAADGDAWLYKSACTIASACISLLLISSVLNSIGLIAMIVHGTNHTHRCLGGQVVSAAAVAAILTTICSALDLVVVVLYHVAVVNQARTGYFSAELPTQSPTGSTNVLNIVMGAGVSWALACVALGMSTVCVSCGIAMHNMLPVSGSAAAASAKNNKTAATNNDIYMYRM